MLRAQGQRGALIKGNERHARLANQGRVPPGLPTPRPQMEITGKPYGPEKGEGFDAPAGVKYNLGQEKNTPETRACVMCAPGIRIASAGWRWR